MNLMKRIYEWAFGPTTASLLREYMARVAHLNGEVAQPDSPDGDYPGTIAGAVYLWTWSYARERHADSQQKLATLAETARRLLRAQLVVMTAAWTAVQWLGAPMITGWRLSALLCSGVVYVAAVAAACLAIYPSGRVLYPPAAEMIQIANAFKEEEAALGAATLLLDGTTRFEVGIMRQKGARVSLAYLLTGAAIFLFILSLASLVRCR